MNTLVTLLFTVVLGLALTLMGLDIDIQIVLQTLKVNQTFKGTVNVLQN